MENTEMIELWLPIGEYRKHFKKLHPDKPTMSYETVHHRVRIGKILTKSSKTKVLYRVLVAKSDLDRMNS